MSVKVAAIICAAGPGQRFGGKRKKQFVDVAGRAAFLRSVELFANREDVAQVLLGIPEEDKELVEVRWGANLSLFNVKLFIGGQTRFETVNKAMQLLKDDIKLVAIHDAARCCVTAEWIDKVIKTAENVAAWPSNRSSSRASSCLTRSEGFISRWGNGIKISLASGSVHTADPPKAHPIKVIPAASRKAPRWWRKVRGKVPKNQVRGEKR